MLSNITELKQNEVASISGGALTPEQILLIASGVWTGLQFFNAFILGKADKESKNKMVATAVGSVLLAYVGGIYFLKNANRIAPPRLGNLTVPVIAKTTLFLYSGITFSDFVGGLVGSVFG